MGQPTTLQPKFCKQKTLVITVTLKYQFFHHPPHKGRFVLDHVCANLVKHHEGELQFSVFAASETVAKPGNLFGAIVLMEIRLTS